MFRFVIHYGIHFLVPIIIGLLFYKKNKTFAIVVLLSGIVIDVDHLFATPLFDSMRCSINFHPLHTYWAITIYIVIFLYKKTRIFGLALLIHILADIADCYMITLN
ncbi:hypothetical protein CLV91_3110 [Maribacter vaceletii]|uniref:LexA-binding, inner membrane-associated hydrolase n=1 Tax=Maribacter vaceletii TaxID=1206816 RepID=A0A495DSL7_9FLAO|nr:DUF6122 family protein [Maribacter vaceletii]RKR07125.1 hypothetical protein CLV91_3110 [Maribacter vaceletii]